MWFRGHCCYFLIVLPVQNIFKCFIITALKALWTEQEMLCSAPYFLLCGVSRSLCFCKKTLKIIYESLFSACHRVLLCMCKCASVSFLWFVCECVAVLIIKTAGTAIRQRVRATNRLLIHLIQTHPDELLSASSDVTHTHTHIFVNCGDIP